MKTGLVLEGGAMRGLFTAGVLDAFLEEELHFDGIVGVSAGAAFGCNFKSRQKGRVLRYNTTYCKDARYCSLRSLVTTGDLYGRKFCYETLPMELDPFDWDNWEQDPTPFWVTCTHVKTGEARNFLCDGDRMKNLDIFCASASMPLVSKKVVLDGEEYLDGGLADSVPLGFMEQQGFERNVVILTQPRAYRKERSSALPIAAMLYGKNSALYKCLESRHDRYNAQREEIFRREGEGKVFVIAPDGPLPVGRIEKDPEKLRLCHRIGYETATKQMDALKAFLR